MTNYLFIESRDPFESLDVRFVAETATALKERGHTVTVFLVQNGVLAWRHTAGRRFLAQRARHSTRRTASRRATGQHRNAR